MAITTKRVLCTAIFDTLKTAPGLKSKQNFDQLTEGYNTLPALRVLPDDWNPSNSGKQNTAQATFGGKVRIERITFTADVVVSQRNNLHLNIAKLVDLADQVDAILYAEQGKPYFGLEDEAENPIIDGFSWSAQRVLIQEADGKEYVGVRYTIVLTVT